MEALFLGRLHSKGASNMKVTSPKIGANTLVTVTYNRETLKNFYISLKYPTNTLASIMLLRIQQM